MVPYVDKCVVARIAQNMANIKGNRSQFFLLSLLFVCSYPHSQWAKPIHLVANNNCGTVQLLQPTINVVLRYQTWYVLYTGIVPFVHTYIVASRGDTEKRLIQSRFVHVHRRPKASPYLISSSLCHTSFRRQHHYYLVRMVHLVHHTTTILFVRVYIYIPTS